MTYLYVKTDTSGLPLWKLPSEDAGQPWVIRLSWELVADEVISERSDLINPRSISPGFEVSEEITGINKITTDMLLAQGLAPSDAWADFLDATMQADDIVGFNVDFDIRMLRILGAKVTGTPWDCKLNKIDVMRLARDVCRIPKMGGTRSDLFKNPTLVEAYEMLIGETKPEPNIGRATIAQIKAVHGKVGGLAL